MLTLGFAEELDSILEAIPSKRQNLLFSYELTGTPPPKIKGSAPIKGKKKSKKDKLREQKAREEARQK